VRWCGLCSRNCAGIEIRLDSVIRIRRGNCREMGGKGEAQGGL
jgi:hypothetical protein